MDNYSQIKEFNKEIKHLEHQIILYQESIERFKNRKIELINKIDKLCSYKNKDDRLCYACTFKF